MKIKCPSCAAEFDLLAALDSASGSELMQLLAKTQPDLARVLMAYLTLFRSPKRALTWDKALRLAKEVLELSTNEGQLSTALQKAVDALREKQINGGFTQLKNHSYLKQVIKDTPAVPVQQKGLVPQETPKAQKFKSKTAKAMLGLEAFKRGN